MTHKEMLASRRASRLDWIRTVLATFKKDEFRKGYSATDAEAFGVLMARYLDGDPSRIKEAVASAYEDANMHFEADWTRSLDKV